MPLWGVGVDLVDVARVRRLLDTGGAFARRWFTAAEAARCHAAPDPAREFAAVLAAKEAAWKSLRVEWRGGVPWAAMEIRPDGTVLLGERLDGLMHASKASRIETRTTRTERLAMAIAFAWTDIPVGHAGSSSTYRYHTGVTS